MVAVGQIMRYNTMQCRWLVTRVTSYCPGICEISRLSLGWSVFYYGIIFVHLAGREPLCGRAVSTHVWLWQWAVCAVERLVGPKPLLLDMFQLIMIIGHCRWCVRRVLPSLGGPNEAQLTVLDLLGESPSAGLPPNSCILCVARSSRAMAVWDTPLLPSFVLV